MNRRSVPDRRYYVRSRFKPHRRRNRFFGSSFLRSRRVKGLRYFRFNKIHFRVRPRRRRTKYRAAATTLLKRFSSSLVIPLFDNQEHTVSVLNSRRSDAIEGFARQCIDIRDRRCNILASSMLSRYLRECIYIQLERTRRIATYTLDNTMNSSMNTSTNIGTNHSASTESADILTSSAELSSYLLCAASDIFVTSYVNSVAMYRCFSTLFIGTMNLLKQFKTQIALFFEFGRSKNLMDSLSRVRKSAAKNLKRLQKYHPDYRKHRKRKDRRNKNKRDNIST